MHHMKTRNAKRIKTGITKQQFEDAMEKYAEAEHREMEINKAIEYEVSELMEKYEDELICLAQGKNKAFETARSYCMNNKAELFGRRRSIGTVNGTVGFRLGTPRLKTGQDSNWNKVLATLKEKLPAYIRISEEPAKDQLLADRHKEDVAPVLMEVGVRVVQDELFYIESKKAA